MPTRRNVGRPRIDLNWQLIYRMCFHQCTIEEIASMLGVHRRTLERAARRDHGCEFSDILKRKAAGGKASLRRKMFKEALKKGNPTMLIWLSKQHLGMSDRGQLELTGADGGPIQMQGTIDPSLLSIGLRRQLIAELESKNVDGAEQLLLGAGADGAASDDDDNDIWDAEIVPSRRVSTRHLIARQPI